jgi:CBS domain-containing protein
MNVAAILRLKGRGVVTTTKDKSLLDIAKLLDQHGIGCIVIEGDNGKVAGIVSERDLMRAIGQSGPKVLKEPVSDFMTKTVVTAREADPIDRLMSEMTTHRLRHMPVVERGRLIGLVSIGDVVKMRIAEVEMETTATREYAGYCQEEGYPPIRLPQSMPHTRAALGTQRINSMERCDVSN